MKDAWQRARIAYEHVEGATAPIFPDLDFTMDARYDDFLAKLGPSGDHDLFDDQGVTGMHAIERILYARRRSAHEVIDFEKTLPGYKAAAFPTNDDRGDGVQDQARAEADRRRDAAPRPSGQPAAIDIGAAFQGLVGLMNEQKEKVNLAATGEEESRYAQHHAVRPAQQPRRHAQDLRAVPPWIQHEARRRRGRRARSRPQLADARRRSTPANTGDALPAVPDDWSSDAPTRGQPRDAVRHAVEDGPRGRRPDARRLGRVRDERGRDDARLPRVRRASDARSRSVARARGRARGCGSGGSDDGDAATRSSRSRRTFAPFRTGRRSTSTARPTTARYPPDVLGPRTQYINSCRRRARPSFPIGTMIVEVRERQRRSSRA